MQFTPTRRFFLLGLAASGFDVHAQDFPSRPIKMIVPYTPGGVADVFGRVLGEMMARDLGQSVVVENKAGANTMIGAAVVAQAPPDGYTMYQATSTILLNPLLYKKLPYEPKALKPLVIAMEAPLVVVINPKVPAKTLKEFAAYARAQNGKLNYSSVGVGNALHFVPELFKKTADFQMTHVPFNGKSGEAFSAVLSGDVEFMATVAAQAVPHIQAGKVRALAVTSAERLSVLPDVPTVAEAGYPTLQSATWYGIAIASATPEPVAARLRQSIDKAIADPAFRSRFDNMGLVVLAPRSPAEVERYVREETQRWSLVIRDQNITLE